MQDIELKRLTDYENDPSAFEELASLLEQQGSYHTRLSEDARREPTNQEVLQHLIHDFAEKDDGFVIAIRYNGDTVGLCLGHAYEEEFPWSVDYGKRKIYIDDLFISDVVRGLGVGSKAMSALCDRAEQEGFSSVELMCASNNFPSIAYYEKNGFRNIREWKVMRREL